MGMFDSIRIECSLPEWIDPSIEFQTKGLDNLLDVYRITPEKRLLHETYTVEDHSDPNATRWMRLSGSMTRIPSGWVDMNYHGYLEFHGISSTGEWFQYNAKFTDGVMVEVKRVKT